MSDDFISRQAAIDIANDLRDCISVDGYWAWIERLKKLPSAQPEQRSDMVSRADMLETYADLYVEFDDNKEICKILHKTYEKLRTLPSTQPEIVRCHKCIHWDRDTVRQNSNDAGWWNEAVCEKYSDEIWTAWKDADWFCADAERRTE